MVKCTITFCPKDFQKSYWITDEELEILQENLKEFITSVEKQVADYIRYEVVSVSGLKSAVKNAGLELQEDMK